MNPKEFFPLNRQPLLTDRAKPAGLAIFQDGHAFVSLEWDWHAQNRKMVAALTEKGYDVNYCWGIGTHSNKQGGAIMPEMLRWLWRDYDRSDDPMDESNRKLFAPASP